MTVPKRVIASPYVVQGHPRGFSGIVPSTEMKPAEYFRRARGVEDALPKDAAQVAVLSSFSASFLKPFLLVETLECQQPMGFWFSAFNQLEQVVLDSASELYAKQHAVAFVCLRLEDIDRRLVDEAPGLAADEIVLRLDRLRQRIEAMVRAIRERSSATIVVANQALVDLQVTLFDRGHPGGLRYLIEDDNRALAAFVSQVPDTHIFDFAGLVAEVGRQAFSDPRQWYMARGVAGTAGLIVLARALARFLVVLTQTPAKCVVVDLDDTLWGGVVGDDGIEGIKTSDDYPGNVFRDFQSALLSLRRQGFLLAISSKNNEDVVRETFKRHPDILLGIDDFAAVQANWDPKPSQLERIAIELNIGLDSLVFVDDNPVERAAVRASLPMVEVVELPRDPAGYRAALISRPSLQRTRLGPE